MRPLRYCINVTLDGCVDHTAIAPDKELHEFHAQNIAKADAMLLGRVTYQMMEEAWRPVAETGKRPEWMEEWMVPFAKTIHSVKKYVVSDSLESVDWNAELIRKNDLETTVRKLKEEPGDGIAVGGVNMPLTLADLGLIDEYEFVVFPVLAGHGPTLFAGLKKPLDLELIGKREFTAGSGAVAMRYAPRHA